MSEAFKAASKYTRQDFLECGIKIGMKENRVA
jgi:hypothetical protein